MEALILAYGYPLIFVLTFLEGETIVLVAGFAAQQDMLGFAGVILSAFLGSFFGDQLYFALGRRYGPRILARRPAWQPKAGRALDLLRRYDAWFILGFRFLYGIRVVSPFILGMSAVPARRYLVLNVVAALIWAVAFAAAGYALGHTVELAFGRFKAAEVYVLASVAVIAAVAGAAHMLRRPAK
ncbi:MAG TPA: DedA family protein [Alphaproteobacteria bacterium]